MVQQKSKFTRFLFFLQYPFSFLIKIVAHIWKTPFVDGLASLNQEAFKESRARVA